MVFLFYVTKDVINGIINCMCCGMIGPKMLIINCHLGNKEAVEPAIYNLFKDFVKDR